MTTTTNDPLVMAVNALAKEVAAGRHGGTRLNYDDVQKRLSEIVTNHKSPGNNLPAAIRGLDETNKALLMWLTSHMETATRSDVEKLRKLILMNQAELTAALDKMTAQTGKIAKEQSDRFDVLTAKIKELTDLIEAGGAITPELEAAATSVQTALDSLDAAIPDAP